MSDYYPHYGIITDISNELNAVLTFTVDHDFTIGEIISIRCSPPYGMVEINNRQSKIISITNDTVTTEIDSTNFTPFVYPAVGEVQVLAMAVPSSSGIVPDSAIPMTNIQDAFDNVP